MDELIKLLKELNSNYTIEIFMGVYICCYLGGYSVARIQVLNQGVKVQGRKAGDIAAHLLKNGVNAEVVD